MAPEGACLVLCQADALPGGIGMLIKHAGSVRTTRIEETSATERRAMTELDSVEPIPLTRIALPELYRPGEAIVVKTPSGIACRGEPFDASCDATARHDRSGKTTRCELNCEGAHGMTVCHGAKAARMMSTLRADAAMRLAVEPVGGASPPASRIWRPMPPSWCAAVSRTTRCSPRAATTLPPPMPVSPSSRRGSRQR